MRAWVHKKKFCTHLCGAPFTGSRFNARIRVPMKRTASMDAKPIDMAAASIPSLSAFTLKLSNSSTGVAIWMPPKTQKNRQERIVPHCPAGGHRRGAIGPQALRRLEVDDAIDHHEGADVQANQDQELETREATHDDGVLEGLIGPADIAGFLLRASSGTKAPEKIGMTSAQRVAQKTEYVAQHIAAWTYSGGLPLPCVSHVTSMRHARERIANMGV